MLFKTENWLKPSHADAIASQMCGMKKNKKIIVGEGSANASLESSKCSLGSVLMNPPPLVRAILPPVSPPLVSF